MTVKEFRKLPDGTTVVWRESAKSPRAGEITETGRVVQPAMGVNYVLWPDEQRTDGRDDWALQQVELPSRTFSGLIDKSTGGQWNAGGGVA